MEVFKFGGATLKDATAIKQMGKMMHNYKVDTIVMVVSAFGKVTQMLEGIVQSKIHNQSYDDAIQELYDYHVTILQGLFEDLPEQLLEELNLCKAQLASLPTSLDTIEAQEQLYSDTVSWGENLSSKIIAAYLSNVGIPCQWVDAGLYIKTHAGRMNAIVDQELTDAAITMNLAPQLSEHNMIVMAGFVARSSEACYPTTLGKEGSDYTGALLAASLQASALRVWKDVPGIMTGDPKLFEDVTTLKKVSYERISAMAAYGAKVIHHNTISPLAINKIPLYVQSLTHEEEPGTVVTADVEDDPSVPIYIVQKDQVWVQLAAKEAAPLDEKSLHKVFISFMQAGIQINYLDITAPYITLCFTDDGIHSKYLLENLKLHFQLKHKHNAALLTIMNFDKPVEEVKMLRHATVLGTITRTKGVTQTVFV